MWRLLLVALALLAACGDAPLKGAGESCVASSECEEGLLCDLEADPATCRGRGQAAREPDAAPGPVFDAMPGAPDGAPVVVTTDAAPPDAAPP